MNYTLRPIDEWPGKRSTSQKRAPFKATWGTTLKLLGREYRHLSGRGALLMLDIREQDIRIDGGIKANARPSWPGVIVAFDSKHGALKYSCDTFSDWASNVHAIALGLEALRKVERYGIARRGEQYRGYRALPGSESDGAMTVDVALGILEKWSGVPAAALKGNRDLIDLAHKAAQKKVHPDVGGKEEDAKLVNRAVELLRAAYNGAPA